MSERYTMSQLDTRAQNLNRRIAETGRHVEVQGRNGYIGLDEFDTSTGALRRTITVGTKREVAEFLHAMMVGIDLANEDSDTEAMPA